MYDYDAVEDDGTMPENVQTLADAVVGHKIVSWERGVPIKHNYWSDTGTRLTLDNGDVVYLADTNDCCAYTALDGILEHLPTIDHIITNVTADDDYNTWHIIADFGEVMTLSVSWSAGNPFYYGYGFDIHVERGMD